MRNLIDEIVARYKSLLLAEDEVDRGVRYYNLCGNDGMINTRRRDTYINGVGDRIRYFYAKFGVCLKCLIYRMTEIVNSNVPPDYVTNTKKGECYRRFSGEVSSFVKYLSDEVDPHWSEIVLKARRAGGNEVSENMERREQHQYQKRNQYHQPHSREYTSREYKSREYKSREPRESKNNERKNYYDNLRNINN
jgi:hypothetical protein